MLSHLRVHQVFLVEITRILIGYFYHFFSLEFFIALLVIIFVDVVVGPRPATECMHIAPTVVHHDVQMVLVATFQRLREVDDGSLNQSNTFLLTLAVGSVGSRVLSRGSSLL